MNYTSYRLEFFNGVRFGHGNLDSTDISFHADTLFSALYQDLAAGSDLVGQDETREGLRDDSQGEESDSVNLVKVRDSIYTGRNSKRKERNYH